MLCLVGYFGEDVVGDVDDCLLVVVGVGCYDVDIDKYIIFCGDCMVFVDL